MRDSLVAINILSGNDKILNSKNNVPILYYWNGEDLDLDKSICNDQNFKSLIYNNVINYENYAISKIVYFYFKIDDEHYVENILNIQDVFKLANLDNESRMFYKKYFWHHFLYLYESAYHEKYEREITLFDIDEAILDIYDKIQEKYPKRVIKSTVINYIRGELQKTDKLTMENTDWIISQLENLLIERK